MSEARGGGMCLSRFRLAAAGFILGSRGCPEARAGICSMELPLAELLLETLGDTAVGLDKELYTCRVPPPPPPWLDVPPTCCRLLAAAPEPLPLDLWLEEGAAELVCRLSAGFVVVGATQGITGLLCVGPEGFLSSHALDSPCTSSDEGDLRASRSAEGSSLSPWTCIWSVSVDSNNSCTNILRSLRSISAFCSDSDSSSLHL